MSHNKKQEHYVSRVHLRMFADASTGKAYIVDTNFRELRYANIENYASERYFYDVDFSKLLEKAQAHFSLSEIPSEIIDFAKTADKQYVENYFGKEMEGKLFIYFKRIFSKYTLSIPEKRFELAAFDANDKSMMSIYLVNQFLRTRNFRDKLNTMHETYIKGECARELNGKIDSRFLESVSITIDDKSALKNFHASFMFDDEEMIRLCKLLCHKIWYIAVTVPENQFHLSDNPVVIDDYYTLLGCSFGSSRVIFPISPMIALVLDDVRVRPETVAFENGFIDVDGSFVTRCNNLQKSQCSRYIFSNKKPPEYADYNSK